MKLVNLENVQKIMNSNIPYPLCYKIENDLLSLPTNDPIAVLKDMIEENFKSNQSDLVDIYLNSAISRITKQ